MVQSNISLLLAITLSLFQLYHSKVVGLDRFALFFYWVCRLVHGFFSVIAFFHIVIVLPNGVNLLQYFLVYFV